MRDNELSIWVIFDSPKDYEGSFVVRRQVATAGCVSWAVRPEAVTSSLENARLRVPTGLIRMERDPTDDPCIAEVWM
jgi:hypothetical protein